MNTRNTWFGDAMLGVIGFGSVFIIAVMGVFYFSQCKLEQAFTQPFESRQLYHENLPGHDTTDPPAAPRVSQSPAPAAFVKAAN